MRFERTTFVLSISLLTFLLVLASAQLAMARQMSTLAGNGSVTTLYVDSEVDVVAHEGNVFAVDVNIANVTDLSAFEFKLGYNTTMLYVLDAVKGSFPPESGTTITIDEPEGYIWVYGMCSPADGGGTMATITFNVTYSDDTSCTLHLFATALYDSAMQWIDHVTLDGSVTVVPEFPAAIVMPLLVITTLAAVLLGKMGPSRKRQGLAIE